MRRSGLLGLSLGCLLLCLADSAQGQPYLAIQKTPGHGLTYRWGRILYYPSPPVPRPVHGRSLYANYGARRLEGRVLDLPYWMIPPGPQALDRYTIARELPPAPRVRHVAPSRYAHPSYSRSSRYRHRGYSRR